MYITIYLWPYKEKNSYKSNRYVTDMDTSSHGSRLNKGVASCATWSQSAVHETTCSILKAPREFLHGGPQDHHKSTRITVVISSGNHGKPRIWAIPIFRNTHCDTR